MVGDLPQKIGRTRIRSEPGPHDRIETWRSWSQSGNFEQFPAQMKGQNPFLVSRFSFLVGCALPSLTRNEKRETIFNRSSATDLRPAYPQCAWFQIRFASSPSLDRKST